ncbi:helix-turn-helix domain-containing protein [Spirillospora sp. CA-294931]|uniref:helix-turn-helix domain-containing protein n=1 Tax=Spirillospora sp. CA-294931 TaxID=3240042 RepID=UPI003D8BB717
MNSPFVRRHRLAVELRALREERGLTAESLSDLLHVSRMKVSKLENAHIRPNLAEIMKILDCLEVKGDKRDEIIDVARGAAEKGWWTGFSDAMDYSQRLFTDAESGATEVREFSQFAIPSVLQSRNYIHSAIKTALARSEFSFTPERALEAQLRRQEQFLAPEGPRYEVVIDEIAIRRPTAPLPVMVSQLRHLVEMATRHPRVTIRILPLTADFSGHILPTSGFSIYNFPDPSDPSIVFAETLGQHVVHIKPERVGKYRRQYKNLREIALSATTSLGLLTDLADDLRNR